MEINTKRIRENLALKETDQIMICVIADIGGYSNGFLYDIDEKGNTTFQGAILREANDTIKASKKLTQFIKKNLGSLKERGLI